ncbi:MAG: VIT domain-containing protein [Reyranella sp.]|uniref:VIT domain-containing protein n=1 Tax=Reyranella sp. TaxID=1929291 RepID=UPI003D0BD078
MPIAQPPASPSPAVPSSVTIDPLAALMVGVLGRTRGHALPLIATAFDVTIDSGLAVVETRRVFRNDEAASIEATITFPLPVHATLFALEARLDGRVLTARAERRKQARLAYEDALERGKAAILHEEVLRGVHMLSIGQIAPGATIEVVTRWAATLAVVQSRGQLRIPLTVGDIYGHSGLPDSDELTCGAPAAQAELVVRCRDGVVSLAGGSLQQGRASVPTDRPIDLLVMQETNHALRGRAADGRDVVLAIRRPDQPGRALDACVLVDRSGSMDGPCSAREPGLTKHRAVTNGLRAMAERLGRSDAIELWQFNDRVNQVGRLNEETGRAQNGRGLPSLVDMLAPPEGGTEIGNALTQAIARSQSRDLLLVTDGKSHALDVQHLARAGRRIAVVLVGEDSLEANVGYLASLTGGDIFVAQDGDLADILVAALESLRTPSAPVPKIEGTLDRIKAVRGGAELEVEWTAATEIALDPILSRAVAALAASLALPALDEAAAAELAEREGLVTHLTSLVLVDEAGAVQETVPAMRKIPLPTPATAVVAAAYDNGPRAAAMAAARHRHEAMASMPMPSPRSEPPDRAPRVGSARPAAPGAPMAPSPLRRGPSFPGPAELLERFLPSRDGDRALAELARLGADIDWDADPGKLQAGDLSGLDRETRKAIRRASTLPEVSALAKKIGFQPVHLIVGLLARAAASRSRTAARLARALLGGAPDTALSDLARRLGLAGA